MDDIACVIDMDPTSRDQNLGAPVDPPIEWFAEPPPAFNFTTMNHVDMCGDVGRFASLLAEDGVPFSFPYPDMVAPDLSQASSYYFNHRFERPLNTRTATGHEPIAAGAIGFRHSPDYMEDLEDIYSYHDRDLAEGWNGAAMERALVRARLVKVDEFVLALGAVVPTLTVNEALAIYNAEISAEMLVMRDADGAERLAIEGASFVLAGNTRTSASTNERVNRATIRKVHPPMNTTTITPPETVTLYQAAHTAPTFDIHKAAGCVSCDARDAEESVAAAQAQTDAFEALEARVTAAEQRADTAEQEHAALVEALMERQLASA